MSSSQNESSENSAATFPASVSCHDVTSDFNTQTTMSSAPMPIEKKIPAVMMTRSASSPKV